MSGAEGRREAPVEVEGRVDAIGPRFEAATGFGYALGREGRAEILYVLKGDGALLAHHAGKSVRVRGKEAGADPSGRFAVLEVEELTEFI